MKDTHTPPRSVRVNNELWAAVKATAVADGRTVTDVVTEALRRYVDERRWAIYATSFRTTDTTE